MTSAAGAGSRLSLLLYFFVAGLICIAGTLACLVGILVALPVAGLGMTHIYDILDKSTAVDAL